MKDQKSGPVSDLRMAVVGVGSLGRHHARILSDMDGVQLVGVVDKDGARASEIAQKYGTNPFSDTSELPGVDGVVISAPTTLHRELAEMFLRKGTGVLCEKPMAASLEECDAILAARDAGGAPLLVGHVEHFNPGVERLAAWVSRPGFIEVHRLGVFTGRSLDVDVILDLMIHDIEIVQSLVKRPVEKVEAVGVSVLTSFVDIANARLAFEGGCVANLTASRISREKVRKLRVFQPASYLAVDYAEQAVDHYRVEDTAEGRNILKVDTPVEKKEPLRAELEHFTAVLRGETEPTVGGEAAREAVRTARMILEKVSR
ncbi:MAG: Gfo/Idh/MocA family oxidoreductase [Acidobacteriota bacterium]|jgi:predicted dehydrogenase